MIGFIQLYWNGWNLIRTLLEGWPFFKEGESELGKKKIKNISRKKERKERRERTEKDKEWKRQKGRND